MLFLRYESFRGYLRAYPGTVVLIALNVIYFIIIALNGDPNDGETAVRMGGFLTVPGIDPFGMEEPWRYISSLFMHASLNHLFFNMFALLVFAPPLEYLLRTTRYLILYMLCGVGGNLLAAAVAVLKGDEYHLSVGASGAIYGVYGAYLFIALLRKSLLDASSRKTVYIILAFGVVYSFLTPQVDVWGHVGGALTGFLLYVVVERKKAWRSGH